MIIMVGGFMGIGILFCLVEVLLEFGVCDLILIVNDIVFVDIGIGLFIVNGWVCKVIVLYIGINLEIGWCMIFGEMDVVLVL